MKTLISQGVLVMLVLSSILSCSSIYEVHYFKDKVNQRSNYINSYLPNYYKVEISGYSFLSSSRYVSGYFEQNAINTYFNEFAQPENGKIFNNNIFTNETGNELVLIFSTNAKAITNQIGSISKSQTVLNSLASIVEKGKTEESKKINSQLETLDVDINQLKSHVDYYLKDIENLSEAQKKLAIAQLLETLKSN